MPLQNRFNGNNYDFYDVKPLDKHNRRNKSNEMNGRKPSRVIQLPIRST